MAVELKEAKQRRSDMLSKCARELCAMGNSVCGDAFVFIQPFFLKYPVVMTA